MPDKNGKFADVALGFDKLEGYLKGHPYFGSNAGRVRQPHRQGRSSRSTARSTRSRPTTAPTTCTAARKASTRRYWKGEPCLAATGAGREVHLHQPRRRGGLPRPPRRSTISYTLTDNNELRHRLPGDDRQADRSATSRTTATSTSPGTTAATSWATRSPSRRQELHARPTTR